VPKTPIGLGRKNVKADVMLLESFLNANENAHLKVNGIYDRLDYYAVIKFQEKYTSDILVPAGLVKGSGYVFTSTLKKMSEIGCK
jgi:hypothetical protein